MVSRAHKKASRATKRDHKSNESALKSDQTIFNKVEELEKIASDLRKDVEIKWLKLSNSVHLLKNEVKYCQIFISYPIPIISILTNSSFHLLFSLLFDIVAGWKRNIGNVIKVIENIAMIKKELPAPYCKSTSNTAARKSALHIFLRNI